MEFYTEKMQHHGGLGFREYVDALEKERQKIQMFQRELPLCLELVTQAVETCRQQLSGTTTENNLHGQSESSEQTTSNEVPPPVFEEFFPIKRCTSSEDDEEEEQLSHKAMTETIISNDSKKKSDWLSSVQLWNQTSDPPPKEDVPRKATVMEVKRNGGSGAFQPFHREKSVGKSNASVGKAPSSLAPEPVPAVAVATTSSSAETTTVGNGGSGGSGSREEKEAQAQRKQRRNWSPELHRRFLSALQQLGGSQAATPKQIRELMKVDGLTNDEVKSHLQKYRLHTRRPSSASHNNGNTQAPQLVVVGGIWVAGPEYAAMAATTASGEVTSVAAANGIYAPVAAPPPTAQQASASQSQRLQQKQSEERVCHSEQRGCSSSPATSSSTHTTH
uniref:Myb n=1 Tax=Betula platyphylla TaxID=78630 RepID=A0A7D7PKG1_BETPL|nr:Myb [Betula platyphylla]